MSILRISVLLLLLVPGVLGVLEQHLPLLEEVDIPTDVTVKIMNGTFNTQELLGESTAETVLLYSLQERRIVLASQDPSLDGNTLLDRHRTLHETYKSSGEREDLRTYLLAVLEDLRPVSCVPFKDGVCTPSCEGDLDCECGDGVCQEHETALTCSTDCKEAGFLECSVLSDDTCRQECRILDPDCEVERTVDLGEGFSEENRQTITYYLTPSLILLLLLLIAYATRVIVTIGGKNGRS